MISPISIRPKQIPAGIIRGGLGSYGKQIEWNTQPVINSLPYNRDGYWDCSDWMTWHSKVEAKYGLKRANEVFLIWWNKQGVAAYADNQCYIFNRTFRDWWKAKKLPAQTLLDYTITNQLDLVTDASGAVVNTAGKVIQTTAEAAENIADAAGGTAKVLKWVVPTLVVGAGAGLAYWAYKKYLS